MLGKDIPSAPHRHNHEKGHGGILHFHAHGPADPSLLATDKGIWAVKWSFVGLMITAVLQIFIVWLTGSVALLADTIHNFGDAFTAIPLWVAFSLSKRPPNKKWTYGYGRLEDLAGVIIVLTILLSAVVSGYETIDRLLHPRDVTFLGGVAMAALIGFFGNELVSIFRTKVGKEINSEALVADGHHAQVDGLTSLAVLLGAVGIWLGYPWADPLVGMIITVAILGIVWGSGKAIITRLLDGVDPMAVDDIKKAACQTEGVKEVTQVRVRWLGHRLHAEINIAVDPCLSVEGGHDIAKDVQHQLIHKLDYLSNSIIHVDPLTASGEEHHPQNEQ